MKGEKNFLKKSKGIKMWTSIHEKTTKKNRKWGMAGDNVKDVNMNGEWWFVFNLLYFCLSFDRKVDTCPFHKYRVITEREWPLAVYDLWEKKEGERESEGEKKRTQ